MAYSETQAAYSIQWSEETYSLREVVTRVGLPTLVKVSEGIYSDNEAESFSCGDLLKLEFVKSIRKVAAKLLHHEHGSQSDKMKTALEQPLKYDYLKDDILIPLGYKGLVEVDQPQRELFNVDELMDEFPKYIRTETKLVDGKSSSVHLAPGELLEVDRLLPKKGIVCRYKNKELIIRKNQNAKFSISPEGRKYTLEEVVEYFQFPQFVRFIDTDFATVQTTNLDEAIENIRHFAGILQLTREVIQNVVVGHHKPFAVYAEKSNCTNRSIALLPLDSISEQQIVFNVPIYSDPEEYHLVMTRNFSQDRVDMSSLDGVLYLEFAKDPKVHLFHTGGDTTKASETILPSRKSEKGKPKSEKPDKVNRKEKKKKKQQPSSPKSPQEHNNEREEDYDYPDMSNLVSHATNKTKVKKPPQNDTDIDNDYDQPDLQKPKTPSKSRRKNPQPLSKSGISQNASNENLDRMYDQADMPDSQTPEKNEKKQLHSTSANVSSAQNPAASKTDYDYPDISTISLPRPIPKSRPRTGNTIVRNPKSIASVTPSVSDQSNVSVVAALPQERISEDRPETVKSFALLSVEEVSKCLKACGLSEFAKVCERELLDGAFLNELSSEELERELFTLSPIQMKKFERIKDGWRPKLEKPRK